jgi:hypothetical protein
VSMYRVTKVFFVFLAFASIFNPVYLVTYVVFGAIAVLGTACLQRNMAVRPARVISYSPRFLGIKLRRIKKKRRRKNE